MFKITNKRENYKTRSKSVSEISSNQKKNECFLISREDFKVDRNGYFIWKSQDTAKNI